MSSKFLISDYSTGLETDKESFLLPEESFPTLEDAYVFRGRVERRFGFVNQGRLRRVYGATALAFATVGGVTETIPDLLNDANILDIPAGTVIRTVEPNAELQPGSIAITVGAYTFDDQNADGVILQQTGPGYVTAITNITQAPQAVVTIGGHNFLNGQQVYIAGVTGMTEINGAYYTIVAIAANTITININSTGFTPYAAAGTTLRVATSINYINGQIILGFTPGGPALVNPTVAFNYFPSFPVMGLKTREQIGINQEQTIAFDTKYAYRYVLPGGWEELPSNLRFVWNGNNSQFFWTTKYRGTVSSEQFFWATNFNQGIGGGDSIYYYDPNAGPASWIVFNPTINGANELWQARIIVSFKDRLVCLNTWEGATLAGSLNYPQRARWSQNGDPTTLATSWLDNVTGAGGYIDASTSEAIISAQFIKDRLIVFFERSTKELVYTGNELLPFVWQKINTELGAESTFSQIPFDDGVIGVGNTGLHVANSSGVQRIDEKIPDEVGKINNTNNGPERVHGIRDYKKEMVYWTFPSFVGNPIFPNRVLVYNYRNSTFAFFNDRFTTYGYFQRTTGYTWATLPYSSWASWNVPWNTAVGQSYFQQIIAGNQQGFTHLFDYSGNNDVSLSVTAVAGSVVTSPNHNLQEGQYIVFNNLTNVTITPIAPNTTQVFQVSRPITANTFTIDGTFVVAPAGYPGGGFIEVLNNFNIKTKNFQLFAEQDKVTFLESLHMFTKITTNGEYTLNLYQDGNTTEPILPLASNPIEIPTLSSVRTRPEENDTFSANQEKIWHPVNRELICQSFQLEFTLSNAQMRNLNIQESDFILHALQINAQPTGRL